MIYEKLFEFWTKIEEEKEEEIKQKRTRKKLWVEKLQGEKTSTFFFIKGNSKVFTFDYFSCVFSSSLLDCKNSKNSLNFN